MDSSEMSPGEMVWNLQNRSGMFGLDGTFPMYVAFLHGYIFSEEARWIDGFRGWLAEKNGDGFNLGWESLVIRIAFPEDSDEWRVFKKRDVESDSLLAGKLFELLSEYIDV